MLEHTVHFFTTLENWNQCIKFTHLLLYQNSVLKLFHLERGSSFLTSIMLLQYI